MLKPVAEIEIKSGIVDSEDLLIRKGNQLHVIMLRLIAVYGVVYSIVNYLQGKFDELVFIFPIIPGVGIAYVFYYLGYPKISKIWNLLQITVSIAGLCLITTPSTFIVAFFIPILIGTLIVFQGKDRKLGLALAVATFAILIILLLTNKRIADVPLLTYEELRVEWLMNTLGAAFLSTLQVLFILSLSNTVQLRLIQKSSELNESNEQLKAAVATRDTMMSILSHDLRSPLLLLSSSMELMRPSKLSLEEQEKLILQLRNRTQQTLSLVDNLLLWSRNQAESVKFVPVDLPIADIRKLITTYTQLLQSEKDVHLTLDCPVDGIVYADKDLLDCILRNIISNAYKFTPRGQTVSIRIFPAGNQWQFSVKDSGAGMSAEMVQRLRNGDSFTTLGTANEKGHGLGLRLVKDFLKLHGTDLEIVSVPAQGSEFSFLLPQGN